MKKGGFTLVEVIVSIIVLAVGILGLAAMVGVVGRQIRIARIETQLAALARVEMERFLATDAGGPGSGSREQGSYRVSWDLTGEGLRELRLVVGYDDGGLNRADTLSTLLHDGQP